MADVADISQDRLSEDPGGQPLGPAATGPPWRTPVAWLGAIALLLIASGGPVVWARAELADLTTWPSDDVWVQALFLGAAGLLIAFAADGLNLLRHDRVTLISVAVMLSVLLLTTAWSVDTARTFEQALLMAFGAAAALLGGATLGRTQVLTALWVALQVGLGLSALADLRDWPLADAGAGRTMGVFGSTDGLGMIALAAAASTIMLMVVVLGRSPEEKLAAAEARRAGGGDGGFRLPSMRTLNELKRAGTAAQRGQFPPGGGMRVPSTPGQAMQHRSTMQARRRRVGSLGVVRGSTAGRIAGALVLVGVLALDVLLWWRSESFGALFAVAATAVVMLVVGLCRPGPSESTRRGLAGVVATVAGAGVVALIVFRDTVGEWFDRDGTWSGRTTIWDGAWEVARDRPIHGYGFEAAVGADPGIGLGVLDVRSGFLQVLVGAGVLGLAAVAWLMLLALRRAASAALLRPDALAVWVVGLVTYGVAANVNESFVGPFSLPFLLLVFGLGHAVARREGRYDDPLG